MYVRFDPGPNAHVNTKKIILDLDGLKCKGRLVLHNELLSWRGGAICLLRGNGHTVDG